MIYPGLVALITQSNLVSRKTSKCMFDLVRHFVTCCWECCPSKPTSKLFTGSHHDTGVSFHCSVYSDPLVSSLWGQSVFSSIQCLSWVTLSFPFHSLCRPHLISVFLCFWLKMVRHDWKVAVVMETRLVTKAGHAGTEGEKKGRRERRRETEGRCVWININMLGGGEGRKKRESERGLNK